MPTTNRCAAVGCSNDARPYMDYCTTGCGAVQIIRDRKHGVGDRLIKDENAEMHRATKHLKPKPLVTPGQVAYVAYMKALCGGPLDRWDHLADHLQGAWETVAEAVRDNQGTD